MLRAGAACVRLHADVGFAVRVRIHTKPTTGVWDLKCPAGWLNGPGSCVDAFKLGAMSNSGPLRSVHAHYSSKLNTYSSADNQI